MIDFKRLYKNWRKAHAQRHVRDALRKAQDALNQGNVFFAHAEVALALTYVQAFNVLDSLAQAQAVQIAQVSQSLAQAAVNKAALNQALASQNQTLLAKTQDQTVLILQALARAQSHAGQAQNQQAFALVQSQTNQDQQAFVQSQNQASMDQEVAHNQTNAQAQDSDSEFRFKPTKSASLSSS